MATPAKTNKAAVAKAAPAAKVDAAAPTDAPVTPVDLYPAAPAPALAADAPLEVEMTRDGQTTWVRNNASVALMQALGWQLT